MKVRKEGDAKLLAFLRNYSDQEQIQRPDEALTDSQIKSVASVLAEEIAKHESGTIVDIGCGHGVLLQRLAELDSFQSKQGWCYPGVDTPRHVDQALELAAKLHLHRRVDVSVLDEFYARWPSDPRTPRPHIAFCRNVLHELDVGTTARLIEHASNGLNVGELFLVQDLEVFPEAERGHVCWTLKNLTKALEHTGFSVVPVRESSLRGNRWLNVIARRTGYRASDRGRFLEVIREERLKQWQYWKSLGLLNEDDGTLRDVRVAKIDFDLQFGALTQQLASIEPNVVTGLTAEEETILLRETFEKALRSFDSEPLTRLDYEFDVADYFVDRGNSRGALDRFLADESRVVVIQGGRLMGKTFLVKKVLSQFPHKRCPVFVNLRASATPWNVIEQILSSIGIRIGTEILAGLKHLNYYDIAPILADFFQAHAANMIVVLDHFELALNPSGTIEDRAIELLLQDIINARGSKLIITCSGSPDARFVPDGLLCAVWQPPVGRFPDEPHHVPNLLKNILGRIEYPQALLDSIDRHPFMAYLAALCIRKRGLQCVDEDGFPDLLKAHLREGIVSRIMDATSRDAVRAFSLLRVPVPRKMAERLSSPESTSAAVDQGILFETHATFGEPVLECIAALRIRSDDDSKQPEDNDFEPPTGDETEQNVLDLHRRIANAYEALYEEDADPRWLRELYYHRLATADEQGVRRIGVLYAEEIVNAGEQWYLWQKDFKKALWAFTVAEEFGCTGYRLAMRRAACLIRTDKPEEGKALYGELIARYPSANGIKQSYVDSLLYKKDFRLALEELERFEFRVDDSPWIAGQFGRAYLGLHRNSDAIRALEYQLRVQPDAVIFQLLARAYHHTGKRAKEKEIVTRGLKTYRESWSLNLAYASILEQEGNGEGAINILLDLDQRNPYSAWLALAMVKTYVRLDRIQEADELWSQRRSFVRPEFLRKNIAVELLIAKRRYEEANRFLTDIADTDEYLVGTRKELHYAWAMSVADPEERVAIARAGLKVPFSPLLETNVPLLVSCAKLALLALDKDSCIYYIHRVDSIAPHVPDLRFVREEATKIWGASI